jgi:hypothetical protein
LTYSLILRRTEDGRVRRDIGENVFLHNIAPEYKVFALYYPSAVRDARLEAALRSLGDLGGRNLFVNIGKLDDPNLAKIATAFDLKTYPVVVLTATSDLAGAEDAGVNIYVRVDDGRLLSDSDRAIRLIQELYGLFLRGDISAAIQKGKRTQRSELIREISATITAGLRGLGDFVANHDFKVSVVTGTFELSRSPT